MIIVKKHAIKRYQERVESISTKAAKQKLIEIVTLGKQKRRKINGKNLKEVEYSIIYEGVEVLAVKNHVNGNIHVITCHGDTELQKWCRGQAMLKRNLIKMVM